MYMEPCNDEQLRLIYDDFETTEESVNENVRILREWVKEEDQSHFPNDIDDIWLKQFLFSGKNNLEKTKEKLELYYKNKISMPEVFENRDPLSPEMRNVAVIFVTVPMPKLTPDGYRILISKIDASPLNTIKPEHLLQFYQIHTDIILRFDQHRGVITIYDMANISLEIVALTFKILRRATKLFMKLTPFRYHKIYILNCPVFAEPLVYVGKKLVQKKIADRIEIWRKPLEELSSSLPQKCLPSDYGGGEPSISELRDKWTDYMNEKKDWLQTFGQQSNVESTKKKFESLAIDDFD